MTHFIIRFSEKAVEVGRIAQLNFVSERRQESFQWMPGRGVHSNFIILISYIDLKYFDRLTVVGIFFGNLTNVNMRLEFIKAGKSCNNYFLDSVILFLC